MLAPFLLPKLFNTHFLMEKAYIILAHKLPEQLYRLVERLNDGYSTFFIHIDKKADIARFDNLSDFGDAIQLIEREDIKWAGISIVDAEINALRAIKAFDKKFDRIILLSGQDYPIKSNEHINKFFRTSPYSVFIEYWSMPNFKIWGEQGGMFRFDKYFFGTKKYEKLRAKCLNFLSILLPFLQRKIPNKLVPYGGWMWWTLDMYALDYILRYIDNNPKYLRYHKYTFAPDETFLQTILLNAKDERLLKSISNNHLRYIFWPDTTKGHPTLLRKQHLKEIKASDALFARKFDSTKDEEILDLIDKNCLLPVNTTSRIEA